MATGGVDGAIRLFARPPLGNFELVSTLRGHENWVREVAFEPICAEYLDGGGEGVGEGGGVGCTPPRGETESTNRQDGAGVQIWLASASQDRNLRVWSIAERFSTPLGEVRSSVEVLAHVLVRSPRQLFHFLDESVRRSCIFILKTRKLQIGHIKPGKSKRS